MGFCILWRQACGMAVVWLGVIMVVAVFALNVWNITIDARALGSIEHCSHPPLKAFLIGSVVSSALTICTCGFTLPAVHIVFVILGHVWYQQAKAACGDASPLLLHTTVQSLAVLWCTIVSNLLTFMCFGFCPILGAAGI